jgi:chromosome segregation ATPase
MEDNLIKEVAELKTALAKANETIATLNKQEVEKVSAEVTNLKEQVIALKALAEKSQAEKDEMEKECAEKMDKMEKETCAKVEEVEKDAKAKLDEAEAKLAEVEKEKTEALRVSKLVAFNVPEDKAKEVVKTFASVNDTMFDEIAALYSNKTAAKVEEKTATTVEDAVEAAKAAVNKPEVKIDKIEENEDRLTAISKSVAEKLNFIKNKGNK